MRAIDLCCGAGGMTAGMMAGGFSVLGVDTVARKDYPAPVLRADVRQLDADFLRPADWVHASPPCTRFSRARPSRVQDPPTVADLDILQACLRLRDQLQLRFWTVENVAGAVPLFSEILGKPRLQHGPFFFWGNFPPFLAARTGLMKNLSANPTESPQRLHKVPRHDIHPMPGTWTEPAADAIATGPVVPRGGSRYVRVPPDWPAGAAVRLLLLPRADAAPTTRSSPAPDLALPAGPTT